MPSWASVTVGQASVVWSAIASFRWLSGECLASLLQSTIYTTSIRVRFTNQHWCYWNHQFKAIASFRQLSDECQQISVTRTNSQNTRFLSNTPTDGFGVRITNTQRFVICITSETLLVEDALLACHARSGTWRGRGGEGTPARDSLVCHVAPSPLLPPCLPGSEVLPAPLLSSCTIADALCGCYQTFKFTEEESRKNGSSHFLES